MKPTTQLIIVALVMCGFSVAPTTLAQARRGAGGGPLARTYDTNTVETIRGEVLSVEKASPPQDRGYGIHLVLKTDKETIPVHLGPASYVEQQAPRIEPKDNVEVTGSRVTLEGKSALIAAQIKIGNHVLKLRDEAGRPAWAGRPGTTPRPGAMVPSAVVNLPEGNPAQGKTAFTALKCYACHTVVGHEFPPPYASPPVPVMLGAEKKRPTRSELADSSVNPSHSLEPGHKEELIRSGRLSRMGDYSHVMTVRQLSDLVAFIESLHRAKGE